MKSSQLIISVIFSSLILFTPAFAQSVPVRVSVPFDFTVGDQRLRAGHYHVAIVHDSVLRAGGLPLIFNGVNCSRATTEVVDCSILPI